MTKERRLPDLPDVDSCLGSTLDSVHRKPAPITKKTTQIIVCRCGDPLAPRRRFEELRAILPILIPLKKYTCLKWHGIIAMEEHMDALKVCASPERCKQNVLAKFRIYNVFPPPSSQRPNLAFLRNICGCFLTWSISFELWFRELRTYSNWEILKFRKMKKNEDNQHATGHRDPQ